MHVSGFATTGDPSWQIGQIGESFNPAEANVVWIQGLVKLSQAFQSEIRCLSGILPD